MSLFFNAYSVQVFCLLVAKFVIANSLDPDQTLQKVWHSDVIPEEYFEEKKHIGKYLQITKNQEKLRSLQRNKW